MVRTETEALPEFLLWAAEAGRVQGAGGSSWLKSPCSRAGRRGMEKVASHPCLAGGFLLWRPGWGTVLLPRSLRFPSPKPLMQCDYRLAPITFMKPGQISQALFFAGISPFGLLCWPQQRVSSPLCHRYMAQNMRGLTCLTLTLVTLSQYGLLHPGSQPASWELLLACRRSLVSSLPQ